MDEIQKAMEEAQKKAMEQAKALQAQMMASMGMDPEVLAQVQASADQSFEMLVGLPDNVDGLMETLFGDDTMSDEELEAFLAEHEVPDDKKPLLMIGALLIGTNDEPYTTLALTGDKDFYREGMVESWGIEGRGDAVETFERLLSTGHRARFGEDFAALQEVGSAGYGAKMGDKAVLDEDDLEIYDAAREAIIDVLELPESRVKACKSMAAWDYERVGLIARILAHVGLITEDEAYDYLAQAAAKASAEFADWEDYIISVLLGRAVAYGLHQEPFAIAFDLLTDSRELLDTYPLSALK